MESSADTEQAKNDYLKLVDFMKRIQMSDKENIEESIASPKSKTSLIPKVPKSY